MNHKITLARPYAKAIFELALSQKKIAQWSKSLSLLTEISKQPIVENLYFSPYVSSSELAELFYNVFKTCVGEDKNVQNLLLLLAHYRRLPVLPFIMDLFEEDRAKLEKTLQITVTSAFPLQESLCDKLQKALEIRLQRDIKMDFEIDTGILGGAVIRAGDLVIDGSVRSKLERLKQLVVS